MISLKYRALLASLACFLLLALVGCPGGEEPLSPHSALSVVLEPAKDSIIAGEELRVEFAVTNQLPEPAFDVTLQFEVDRPGKLVVVSSSRGDCEGSVCEIGSFDGHESVTGHIVATQGPSFDEKTEIKVDANVSWLLVDSRRSYWEGHATAQLVDGGQPGSLIWTTKVDANGVGCGDGIEVGAEAVYATFADEIYAFSRSTGEEIWDYRRTNRLTDPVLADGSIYFHSWGRDENDESRYFSFSLDASQGKLNWRHSDVGSIRGRALVHDGILFFAINEEEPDGQEKYGNLTALDPMSGFLKWRYKVETWIASSPVEIEGNIYFSTREGDDAFLYSIDPVTGELNRKASISSNANSINEYGEPLWSPDSIYIASESNVLNSIDLATGETNWSYTVRGNGFNTPELHQGSLYLLVWDQNSKGPFAMHVVDAGDGSLKWRYQPGERIEAVVLDGESAYITSKSGLVSLDASTGIQKWEAGYAFICGPPAVVDGVLYGRATLDLFGYIAFAIRGE